MDIHMPGMNGFDATEQIRHNTNPNTATPVFALTADITAESNEDYKNYFTGFCANPSKLTACIWRCCRCPEARR
jgi:CheY-like chemotaxis protein